MPQPGWVMKIQTKQINVLYFIATIKHYIFMLIALALKKLDYEYKSINLLKSEQVIVLHYVCAF